jgi:hypothetical protein
MRIIVAVWIVAILFVVSRIGTDRSGTILEIQCGRAEQRLDVSRNVSVPVPVRCAEEYAADVAAQFAYNPHHAALVGIVGFLSGLGALWVFTVIAVLVGNEETGLRRLDLFVGLITMIGIGGIAIGVVGSAPLVDQLSRIGVLGSPAMVVWVTFALAAATGYGLIRLGVHQAQGEPVGVAPLAT